MRGNSRSVCLAAFACIFVFALASSSSAADELHDRYMKVCKDDLARNDPGWAPAQAEQLCTCRARFLWAKQSKSDIALLVGAFEKQDLIEIPERLNQADLAYYETCADDFAATP